MANIIILSINLTTRGYIPPGSAKIAGVPQALNLVFIDRNSRSIMLNEQATTKTLLDDLKGVVNAAQFVNIQRIETVLC